MVVRRRSQQNRLKSMSEEKQATTSASGAYAVIETGGKQYRVKEGDRITVERLATEAGQDVTIDRVLMLGGTGSTKIGTPVVDGASVTAHVDEHMRGEKLIIFKFKPKKRYRRRTGHRQELTKLTITGITG
jgi:large subunit ribosomal protein L21